MASACLPVGSIDKHAALHQPHAEPKPAWPLQLACSSAERTDLNDAHQHAGQCHQLVFVCST